MITDDGRAQWSCGQVAGSMCLQCHQELIQRANALAAENEQLSEALDDAISAIGAVAAAWGSRSRCS